MAQRLAVVADGSWRGIWMRAASSAPVRARGIGAAGAARVAIGRGSFRERKWVRGGAAAGAARVGERVEWSAVVTRASAAAATWAGLLHSRRLGRHGTRRPVATRRLVREHDSMPAERSIVRTHSAASACALDGPQVVCGSARCGCGARCSGSRGAAAIHHCRSRFGRRPSEISLTGPPSMPGAAWSSAATRRSVRDVRYRAAIPTVRLLFSRWLGGGIDSARGHGRNACHRRGACPP